MTSVLQFEVVADGHIAGAWRAEAIGEDGEVYVTIFAGPRAESRAREYAASSLHRWAPLFVAAAALTGEKPR